MSTADTTRPEFTTTDTDRGASVRLPYGVENYVDEVGVQVTSDGEGVTISLLVDLNTTDPDAVPDGGFAELTIPRAAWDALTAAIAKQARA